MYAKATVIGNLGKDPESRQAGESTVCSFSVATKDRETTTWYRVNAFGKLGELCARYLSKGKLVYCEGRLSVRKWTDKDGKERESIEITANEVKFLSRKDEPSSTANSEDLVPF